jgi:hypothetical protein
MSDATTSAELPVHKPGTNTSHKPGHAKPRSNACPSPDNSIVSVSAAATLTAGMASNFNCLHGSFVTRRPRLRGVASGTELTEPLANYW